MTDETKPSKIRNIAELARLAGVSSGTVSRALSNMSLVNKETRERIQALAREHGFRPNQMARRLRTQRTGVVGVTFPIGHQQRHQISDPFFMSLFGYLADGLIEKGYDVMLSRVANGDDEWLDRIVDSGMLDGAIVIGQSNQVEYIESVARRYRPMVVWGRHLEGHVQCTVGTDNAAGGALVARCMLDSGARHLAFFGDATGPQLAERLSGVRETVAGNPEATLRTFHTQLAGELMAGDIRAHLDELGDTIDGIVCASDLIAMTTIRQLHERGVAVPAKVAVTGFDDLSLAARMVPQLTTVRQDVAAAARAMVDALQRRIDGEDAPYTVLQPELVRRESA